jgi:hypothetical protein
MITLAVSLCGPVDCDFMAAVPRDAAAEVKLRVPVPAASGPTGVFNPFPRVTEAVHRKRPDLPVGAWIVDFDPETGEISYLTKDVTVLVPPGSIILKFDKTTRQLHFLLPDGTTPPPQALPWRPPANSTEDDDEREPFDLDLAPRRPRAA